MIVRARSPFVLGNRRGASHAGYRRRGMGDLRSDCASGNAAACKQYYTTVYDVAPSVVAANPEGTTGYATAASLGINSLAQAQAQAALTAAAHAPTVYTCPTCAGMSTDPAVFQTAAYVTQLNALGATSAVNDENARRFANYQNAVANALYASAPLPNPPVYMTLADYYAANPSLSQPSNLFGTAPAGSTIPSSGGEYQGGFIPPGGTAPAPPPPAPPPPAATTPAVTTKPVIPFTQGNTPGSFGTLPVSTATTPIGQSNAPAPVTVGGGAGQSNAPGATFQTVLGIPVASSWLSGTVFGIPTWWLVAGGVGLGALFLLKRK